MAPIGDDVAQKILDSIQDLQSRIKKLEDGIHNKTTSAPSESVRMVLMGPPGAGKSRYGCGIVKRHRLICSQQARELKHQRSRRNSHAVTWYVIGKTPGKIWPFF